MPADLLADLERVKTSDEELRAFAVDFGVKFCSRLIELEAPCLHFYTLNTSATSAAIVERLDLASSSSSDGFVQTEEAL